MNESCLCRCRIETTDDGRRGRRDRWWWWWCCLSIAINSDFVSHSAAYTYTELSTNKLGEIKAYRSRLRSRWSCRLSTKVNRHVYVGAWRCVFTHMHDCLYLWAREQLFFTCTRAQRKKKKIILFIDCSSFFFLLCKYFSIVNRHIARMVQNGKRNTWVLNISAKSWPERNKVRTCLNASAEKTTNFLLCRSDQNREQRPNVKWKRNYQRANSAISRCFITSKSRKHTHTHTETAHRRIERASWMETW